MTATTTPLLKERFRGFMPVIIDIETAGFDAQTNAILEIAAITVKMTDKGFLQADQTLHFHVQPFEGAILNPDALSFNGIDPHNPLRQAVSEQQALTDIFQMVRQSIKANQCNRAIVVAHNAHFDHSFLLAGAQRCGIKRNPFHPFSTFDTATLAGLVYGQTVLAKACQTAGIEFDHRQAHSALYDTVKTTQLFCQMVNKWKILGGWPLPVIQPEQQNDINQPVIS